MASRGFIKLSTVICIVLGLGFGASAFLNYWQHQRAAQDEKLLQGQIVDLRYQVNQDHATMATPSDNPSPSATPSASPTAAPSDSSSPSPTPAVLDANTTTKTNTCNPASFRSVANAKAGLIAKLPKGVVVTLTGTITNSYQQVTYNGQAGYILASCLK